MKNFGENTEERSGEQIDSCADLRGSFLSPYFIMIGRYNFESASRNPQNPPLIDRPGGEQFFKLEHASKQMNTGKLMHDGVYRITSLTVKEADTVRLLEITLKHDGFERGL